MKLSRWIVAIAWQEFLEDQAKPQENRKWKNQLAFAMCCFPLASRQSAPVRLLYLVKGVPSDGRVPELTVHDAQKLAQALGRNLSELVFQAECLVKAGSTFPEGVAYDTPVAPRAPLSPGLGHK